MQQEKKETALERFRLIAIAEGISFLVLMFIAMPLKYFAGIPEVVMVVGWIHGILFIAYMIMGLVVRHKYKWKFRKVLIAVVAAFLPFGPFLLDNYLLKPEIKGRQSARE